MRSKKSTKASYYETETSETVSDAVFRQIRHDIILGVLKPSTKIKLEQASQKYSVSVTSLREILCRLTAENMVVAEGQRGFEVCPVSRKELLELADLRIVLECHAIDLSFELGDLEWEGRIVSAYHKLAAAEQNLLKGDISQTMDWVTCDWEFHRAIVSSCNSTALIQNLSSVFDRFLRYHILAQSFRGRPVVDDHKLLFETSLKKDASAAKTIVRKHIRSGADHILEHGKLSGEGFAA